MKKMLAFLLIFSLMVSIGAVCAAEDASEALIPCMVTGNHVNERLGPGKGYDSVAQHDKGEILDVVDTTGKWWKLANGHYMYAKYLEPMCSNDVEEDVEETEDWLVRESVEDVAAYARLLNFTVASSGATKEDIVAATHNCVLLITREQCIECYQNDQLILKIELVLSTPYVTFAVTNGADNNAYEVRYIRDVAALIQNNSTDYTYFVVID